MDEESIQRLSRDACFEKREEIGQHRADTLKKMKIKLRMLSSYPKLCPLYIQNYLNTYKLNQKGTTNLNVAWILLKFLLYEINCHCKKKFIIMPTTIFSLFIPHSKMREIKETRENH